MNSLEQWNSAQSACFARVLLAGFSPTQRLELRRQKAQPIVEALKGRVESARASALPRSALGKACDYSLAAGAATTVSGLREIELSNNLLAENAIRLVAIGLRNWLHVAASEPVRGSPPSCRLSRPVDGTKYRFVSTLAAPTSLWRFFY